MKEKEKRFAESRVLNPRKKKGGGEGNPDEAILAG